MRQKSFIALVPDGRRRGLVGRRGEKNPVVLILRERVVVVMIRLALTRRLRGRRRDQTSRRIDPFVGEVLGVGVGLEARLVRSGLVVKVTVESRRAGDRDPAVQPVPVRSIS